MKKTANNILQDLNKEQREAVKFGEGPLLVIAGAGTGKTTVITRRVAFLIATKRARPSEILALTFTDKAANEMVERVDVLVPYGFNDAWISTFHSFGDKILREEGVKIGIPPDFKLLNLQESIIFFRENLFEFQNGVKRLIPLSDPTRYIPAIIQTICRAKDEDISPEEYIKCVEKMDNMLDPEKFQRQYEFSLIYKKYEELKLRQNLVDFGDLIVLTLKLFREIPEVLDKYRAQYKYILVDEFQDTNYAQFEILKLLTSEGPRNITVVADDDQSIYKFRGACMSNVINFKKYYPDAEIITITTNYRSTQPILDSAYKLITHNNPDRLEKKYGISKRLKSNVSATGIAPQFYRFDTVHSEADFVAKMIKEKVEKGVCSYKDCAILVRSNDLADEFLKSLNYYNIPWKFSGGRNLLMRKEVRLLLNILRLLNDPFDSRSFFDVASSELYDVDIMTLSFLSHIASESNRSIYEIVSRFQDNVKDRVSEENLKKIQILVEDVNKYVQDIASVSAGKLLYSFLDNRGYIRKLAEARNISDIEKVINIKNFFDILEGLGKTKKVFDLKSTIEYLEYLAENTEEWQYEYHDFDVDAVNVLTIHRAKGLEFDVVFLVGLVEGKFPARVRGEFIELPDELIKDVEISKEYHLQEERRLFYVGMTRAKNELYLTAAEDYKTKKKWKISRFVSEALDKPVDEFAKVEIPAIDIIKKHSVDEKVSPQIMVPEKLELSPYKIDDYLTCPLKYNYIHITRIPIRRVHTLVFGEVLHRVLIELHKAQMKRQKLTVDDLKNFYTKYWLSEGYLSREHEERRFAEGLEILMKYYNEVYLKSEETPFEIEGEFRFLFDKNVTIKGRWDRLDKTNSEFVLTDYKTSRVSGQKEADNKTRNNIQLLVYALGHKEKYNCYPSRLQLYFLESNILGKTMVSDKKITDIKEKINHVIKGLKEKDFSPKPDYHNCSYCPYNSICPHSYTLASET